MFANYPHYEYAVTATLCVFAMFGMGTTLTAGAFKGVVKRPAGLAAILLMQVIVSPLLALLFIRWFSMPPEIALGLILVTALPGGLFSNVFAYFGKCDAALSISATAVCTLGCLVTTSFVLQTFGSAQLPANFEMPVGSILFEIGCCLMLPLVVGLVARRLFAERAQSLGTASVRVASVLLVFFVIAAMGSGRIDIAAYGWKTQLGLITFGISLIALSYLAAYLVRLNIMYGYTIAIEVVVRNVHLGLLLKASLFPAEENSGGSMSDGILYALLFYGGASIITGAAIAGARRIELKIWGDRHWGPPPEDVGAAQIVRPFRSMAKSDDDAPDGSAVA